MAIGHGRAGCCAAAAQKVLQRFAQLAIGSVQQRKRLRIARAPGGAQQAAQDIPIQPGLIQPALSQRQRQGAEQAGQRIALPGGGGAQRGSLGQGNVRAAVAQRGVEQQRGIAKAGGQQLRGRLARQIQQPQRPAQRKAQGVGAACDFHIDGHQALTLSTAPFTRSTQPKPIAPSTCAAPREQLLTRAGKV